MKIDVARVPPSALAEYARVPIAFEVRSVLDVVPAEEGLGGLALSERVLDAPYVKDYDASGPEHPPAWAERFDLSAGWAFFAAREGGRWVGAAAAAHDAPGLDWFDGRRDVAVLQDIRVAPEARGRGVGAALLRAVEGWAIDRGARRMKVETQNVNAGACRFYARQGFVLGAIHRFAYPDLPGEARLLWYKDLPSDG